MLIDFGMKMNILNTSSEQLVGVLFLTGNAPRFCKPNSGVCFQSHSHRCSEGNDDVVEITNV